MVAMLKELQGLYEYKISGETNLKHNAVRIKLEDPISNHSQPWMLKDDFVPIAVCPPNGKTTVCILILRSKKTDTKSIKQINKLASMPSSKKMYQLRLAERNIIEYVPGVQQVQNHAISSHGQSDFAFRLLGPTFLPQY